MTRINYFTCSLISILIVISSSCTTKISDDSKIKLSDVIVPITVPEDSVVISSRPILSQISEIETNDNFLVVYDYSKDTLHYILSLPDLSYRGWIGARSREANYRSMNFNGLRFHGDTLQSVDGDTISLFSLKKSESPICNPEPIERYLLTPRLRSCYYNNIFMLNNDSVYGIIPLMGTAPNYEFESFHKRSGELGARTRCPIVPPKNGDPAVVGFINNGIVDIKQDRSLIAKAYRYAPMLRVFGSDGGVVCTTKVQGLYPENDFRKCVADRAQGGNLSLLGRFYDRINVTDEFIYALYYPLGGLEIDDKGNEVHVFKGDVEVHIFDWNGNIKRRIIVDYRTKSIAISSDDSTLYTIRKGSENSIYRYYLN